MLKPDDFERSMVIMYMDSVYRWDICVLGEGYSSLNLFSSRDLNSPIVQ